MGRDSVAGAEQREAESGLTRLEKQEEAQEPRSACGFFGFCLKGQRGAIEVP